MSNATRAWTDDHDAVAYDAFKQLASRTSLAFAQSFMGRMQSVGLPVLNADVDAWASRYQAEDEWAEVQSQQEREADEFVFRNSTI